MKFELIELREDRIRFLLSGVTAAFANGIRRACMSEVPILAIDQISLYDNTSVLFDEQIALRLGLVPLQSKDLDSYSRPEDCQCGGEGCPGCRVDFMLSAEGPGMVYSKDIQFTDPGVKPAFDKIPIVILGEGEKVVIEGFATKRVGKDHSKWQAGTLCGYKNLPKIEIGASCDGCGKCIEVCPRDVLALEEGRAKATNILECSLCKLCIEECEAGALKVTPVLDSFVISIESSGVMPVKELVAKAAQEIRKRAEDLDAKLAELT
ncbi:MAG: DNA-directed RNA polymerase subunit D [Methanosaeta sp. PtaU1.Bin060]|nr:MAG: DNA-directed RNA polymerase subunit D [Methanosaeta sp. PtaU1.Bin060]